MFETMKFVTHINHHWIFNLIKIMKSEKKQIHWISIYIYVKNNKKTYRLKQEINETLIDQNVHAHHACTFVKLFVPRTLYIKISFSNRWFLWSFEHKKNSNQNKHQGRKDFRYNAWTWMVYAQDMYCTFAV